MAEEMTYNSGIKYSDPIDDGTSGPYDGQPIKPDRKGGWNVTHEKLGYWIRAVPTRELAGRIHEALEKMAETK